MNNNPDDHLEFLREISQTKPVQTLILANEHLPDSSQRRRLSFFDAEVANGWLMTKQGRHDHIRDVYYVDVNAEREETVKSTGYWLEDPRFSLIGRAKIPPSYGNLVNPEHRMRTDLHALLAAEAFGADLFVCNRPLLFEDELGIVRETTVVSVAEAIPIIGLYLRSQDIYFMERSSVHEECWSRGLFYNAAMRELLPASWTWSTGCALRYQITKEEDLVFCEDAAVERVRRALRTRDNVLVLCSAPNTDERTEDILAGLDAICLWLMAAFDASSQVAHIVLGLGGSSKSAAWQNDGSDGTQGWLGKVRKEVPQLADLVSRGSSGKRVLTILGELRNTIHGSALYPIYSGDDNSRMEMYVKFPSARRSKILEAMDIEGGRTGWGVYGLTDADLRIHPGELIDRLISSSLRLLNSLMGLTPVERSLDASRQARVQTRPEEPRNPYNERYGERIRFQLGL